jgi:tRNA (guanine-N7-)-methyltransferase
MSFMKPDNILTPGQVAAAGGWNAVFGNERPLNLEIGVGGGEFFLEMGRRHPDENFVGLDIASRYLRRAARKSQRQGLHHLRFLSTEAKVCLYELFGHETIQNVYVNFPDPWPKKSHERRRLFDERFVGLLEDRLIPGGFIYLGTDVPAYAEQAHQVLSASTILTNNYPTPWLNDRGWTGLQTKYEAKWSEMGKELFYLAFSKTKGLHTHRYEIERTAFQPLHVSGLSLSDAIGKLNGMVRKEGKYVFKTLSVKPAGDTVKSKLLLIDTGMEFKDYLQLLLKSGQDGVTVEVENPMDFVCTESKQRALIRFFDDLAALIA